MKKHLLECTYGIQYFENHNVLKNELLNLINQSPYTPVIDPRCETDISKTDWANAQNLNRDWVQFFAKHFTSPILEMYKHLGYDGYTLHDLWFQQYEHNSGHGWHTHSANFTNVYYLELPDTAPPTRLVSPFDQTTVIEVDVKEGDMLVFPSFVIHKGPANVSSSRKTIISYNINATYSNDIYGQGIKENAIF